MAEQNPFKKLSDESKSSGNPPNFVAGEKSDAGAPKPACWPAKDRAQQSSSPEQRSAGMNPKSIPAGGVYAPQAVKPQSSGNNPPVNQPGNKPGDASPKPYKLKS